MDSAPLPNDMEAIRTRIETAQRKNSKNTHWDSNKVMDGATANILSFAGLKCRVIGTFYIEPRNEASDEIVLKFGSDISNYYPNEGLLVYKPNAEALKMIINYRDPLREAEHLAQPEVSLGLIRYASTNRAFQGVNDVEVKISPADLKTQKTAIFGMTRTGKSNTTKIIAQSVFDLRSNEQNSQRIGQLIFDLNGEYANENTQDPNGAARPDALKNVWRSHGDKFKDDVMTYGVSRHPNDDNRTLMLINFHDESTIQIGKEYINNELSKNDSSYIKGFCQVHFTRPDINDRSATTRYNRRLLVYRTLLNKAGFTAPTINNLRSTNGLFSNELLRGRPNAQQNSFVGMDAVPSNSNDLESVAKSDRFRNAATILNMPNPSWGALASAFEILFEYMTTAEYKAFNQWYINDRPNASGDSWADTDFEKVIKLFDKNLPNGIRLMGAVTNLHSEDNNTDYAFDIYTHLAAGKLIIVDQSSGEWTVNDSSARRIIQRIFNENQALFTSGSPDIPDILVYIEEAHNLLPSGSETNYKDIWVRTAKEGAKYKIGMIYATQEVSSIQKNILKNTTNWFIGHLNNTDETRELRKYYDFEDFEKSILRAQDKGFLRVKTLSNPFVIPVQVKKFELSIS